MTMTKTCCTCGKALPFEAFAKDRTKSDGHHSKCRQCKSLHEKNIRLAGGRHTDRERMSKWLATNRKIKQKADRDYYAKNSTEKKAYIAQYRKSNTLYGMAHRVRTLINTGLKKRGYGKRSKTNDILGCSYSEFVAHIERQFTEGMNWDNRASWHIDHIVPVSSAANEAELLKLNHFSNLRPLWAADNLRKSNKRDYVA